MNLNGTCPACKALGGIIQCNRCRRTAPNAQTLTRQAVLATMRETGATAADAEAAHGVAGTRAVS